MFSIEETILPGLKLIQPRIFEDVRGSFVKTFHHGLFESLGMDSTFRESFLSVSRKNVVRGMHFQVPPAAHSKLIYCTAGRVLDVVVDLRRDSPTFLRCASHEISASNRKMFFIPIGFAHGFLSLEDDTVMVYQTSTVHHPDLDSGILWNSFGFDWGVLDPIISDRDRAFPPLQHFDSPF